MKKMTKEEFMERYRNDDRPTKKLTEDERKREELKRKRHIIKMARAKERDFHLHNKEVSERIKSKKFI